MLFLRNKDKKESLVYESYDSNIKPFKKLQMSRTKAKSGCVPMTNGSNLVSWVATKDIFKLEKICISNAFVRIINHARFVSFKLQIKPNELNHVNRKFTGNKVGSFEIMPLKFKRL